MSLPNSQRQEQLIGSFSPDLHGAEADDVKQLIQESTELQWR